MNAKILILPTRKLDLQYFNEYLEFEAKRVCDQLNLIRQLYSKCIHADCNIFLPKQFSCVFSCLNTASQRKNIIKPNLVE
jgi:hypothetical protein